MLVLFIISAFAIVGWLNANLPAQTVIDIAPINAQSEVMREIDCELTASSGFMLVDEQELCSKEPDKVLPIASITKLVSALVFLDHNPGWDTVYRIKPDDRRNGGRIYLFSGDEVSAKDLFYNALIASDNTAVIGLVNLSNLTEEEFVNEMNLKAREFGLFNTIFIEPTGLSNQNKSTAREVAKFAKAAFNEPDIRQTVLNSEYSFVTKQGKKRTVYSTGQPLASQLHNMDFLGGKTGYLADIGYCFVGLFSYEEQEIITVVLGSETREQGFSNTAKFLESFNKYINN
ncbi:MAG: serine hydrolase [bacterium]